METMGRVGANKSREEGKVTKRALLQLIESQDYRCALTGRELSPETASLDHRSPLSRGGTDTMDNAQIIDWQINKAKGTMSNEEFISMCIEVVQHCQCDMSNRRDEDCPSVMSIRQAQAPL